MTETVKKIIFAFQNNNIEQLKTLWFQQTMSQMINFDFEYFCDHLGYIQISGMPSESVKFFIENCGKKFLDPLSNKYRMNFALVENEFSAYCNHFPSLVPTFEKHFGIEKKQDVKRIEETCQDVATEKSSLTDTALEKIEKNVKDGNYKIALEACQKLSLYLECVEYFTK